MVISIRSDNADSYDLRRCNVMNNQNNAKHRSKQVKKKLGVPNLNTEFAAETGASVAGADAKASKGASQKSKQ